MQVSMNVTGAVLSVMVRAVGLVTLKSVITVMIM